MTKTLLLFLVSLFSVFACAEIQTGSITPETGKPTLVYCSEGNPEGLFAEKFITSLKIILCLATSIITIFIGSEP